MISQATLYGGAQYNSFGSSLVLSGGAKRIITVNPTGAGLKILLPKKADFNRVGHRYYILNVSANSVDLWNAVTSTRTYDTISANASDNSFISDVGYWQPGSQILVSGFSNSANNGTFTVVSRSCGGGKVIVSGGTLVNEVVAPPPLPALPTVFVTITDQKLITLPSGHVGMVLLCTNSHYNIREWATVHKAYGAVAAFSHSTHTSICSSIVGPPSPPPPPPPYDGSVAVDLTSCAATKTITIAGGTGVGTVWNGVWTVTKVGTTYYRKVIDANHYIDIRAYSGGLSSFHWQVVCVDLTGTVSKRFGNNTAGTCPPNASYSCFAFAADVADCTTGGTLTCVVSA